MERLPKAELNLWHRCFFLLHIFIFAVSVVCFVAVKGVWFASATTAGIAVALLLAGGMPDGWLVAFTNRPQPHHRRWLALARPVLLLLLADILMLYALLALAFWPNRL